MKSPKLELQRALRHVAARFPQDREPVLTDIALRVFPHSGEVRFYDDEEQELMRIVIPEWIKGSCDEAFYDKVAPVLRQVLAVEHAYTGMLGGGPKRAFVTGKLLEDGVPQERIDRLHTPVGLSIGAVTPAEIAVSIAAEMVMVRAQHRGAARG